MINKIYIPTLGRCANQVTWDHLPSFLKSIAVFVVQPKEQKYFSDKPHVLLPDNDIGISSTRKWIWEHARNEIYGVFDDDLTFVKRNPSGYPTKSAMTDEDWKTALDGIMGWLDDDCGFAGFRRGNLPPRDKDWNDNTESLQAVFYNGKKLPNVDELAWTPNLYAEDVKLHLQLILFGHKNRVWTTYGMKSNQFTEGGCQADTSISPKGRTPEDTDRSHQHMVDEYYPYARFSLKKGEVLKSPDGSRKIKIFYRNAYKNRQSERLH